ncbi:MAG: hypothetical protein ACTSRP_06960 [Candidatus Helarchaeota archaeon]
MPKGIILAKWDEEIGLGALLEAQFPPEDMFKVSVEDLVTIYTFHSMGGLKNGFMMITRKDLNVASYFFKIKDESKDNSTSYYLSIILTKNEKAADFQNFLVNNVGSLIPLIKNKDFKQIELKLACFYTDLLFSLIKRIIMIERSNIKKLKEKDKEIEQLKNKIEEYKIKIDQLQMLNNNPLTSKEETLLNENINLKKEIKRKELKLRELETYINRLKLREEKLNKELSILRSKLIELKVS